MRLFRSECECGRAFGSKVIRQHRRRCVAQLRAWKKEGRDLALLDDRSEDAKKKEPIE